MAKAVLIPPPTGVTLTLSIEEARAVQAVLLWVKYSDKGYTGAAKRVYFALRDTFGEGGLTVYDIETNTCPHELVFQGEENGA
jgi:hypothetical protein